MSSLNLLVGNNIKHIRKIKNLTQEQLAELCGLQTSYIAGVERGERNITLQTLEKILTGLGITPIQLFNLQITNSNDTFDTSEIISEIQLKLNNKSSKEINLINNLIDLIFKTYSKH